MNLLWKDNRVPSQQFGSDLNSWQLSLYHLPLKDLGLVLSHAALIRKIFLSFLSSGGWFSLFDHKIPVNFSLSFILLIIF